MFQHQLFTEAELNADPRLAALLQDKMALLDAIERIAALHEPSPACDIASQARLRHIGIERQREAAHHAAVQAENVRLGWKPATFREILGEPDYVPYAPGLDEPQEPEKDAG